MNESQLIAAYIDAWRSERDMSGNTFTTHAGVASNFLTQLRRGADVQLSTLARAAQSMDMTLLELLAASGVGGPTVPSPGDERRDILTLIATDPDLLPEAKQHFANQYRLLRRISATPDVTPSQDDYVAAAEIRDGSDEANYDA